MLIGFYSVIYIIYLSTTKSFLERNASHLNFKHSVLVEYHNRCLTLGFLPVESFATRTSQTLWLGPVVWFVHTHGVKICFVCVRSTASESFIALYLRWETKQKQVDLLPNQVSLPGARTEQGPLGLYPACLALEGTGCLSLVSCWTCI